MLSFYTPPHKKSQNHLSVHPSVRTLFPDSNFSNFWPIFFKLCMDSDIREERFGIANGLNSFINRIMALDWCKNVFFVSIFRKNGWILIKVCICIDIYKIHVSNACYLWSSFNKVMALDRLQFCLFSISCELICGFRSNFVYALILTRCRFGWLNNIFRSFSTELWPLIDVEISFLLNILWTNWWILVNFCCIDIDKMYVRTITNYILLFFNWVMALDWCQNLFSFNTLRTNWWILCMQYCD